MKLKILQDIPKGSGKEKNSLYASKNDNITLITDSHFPVLICEDSKGNRFPVKAEFTNYIK